MASIGDILTIVLVFMIQQAKSRLFAEPSASCGQSVFAKNPYFLRDYRSRVRALNSVFVFKTVFLGLIMMPHFVTAQEIVAAHVSREIPLDAAYPASEWQSTQPITFSSDWQGLNPDPARQTSVRVLWNEQTLYLRSECRYRDLHVFSDSDPNGRRDQLWDRDVVEVFLQPDPSREHFYKEFEVAPNAMWIDLDIFPGGRSDLKSGMKRSAYLDRQSRTWSVELAIPMKSLTEHFDPQAVWRVNFYRVEGLSEPRAYLAWQPTNTPKPNFHVPSAFGRLRFAPPPKP